MKTIYRRKWVLETHFKGDYKYRRCFHKNQVQSIPDTCHVRQTITRDLILWKQKQQPEPTCEVDMIWVWFASLEACICNGDPALTKKYIADSFLY